MYEYDECACEEHDWVETTCPLCGAWQGDVCTLCGEWSDGGDWMCQFLDECTCSHEELEAYYSAYYANERVQSTQLIATEGE